jgi:hypothetical protein
MIDFFNVDLPNKADIDNLLDTLTKFLKKVEVRKHIVTLGVPPKTGKLVSINMPVWD